MSTKPILYSFYASSCTWRVRIALAYKGIEYEERFVDLAEDEQFDPEFKALNPSGFVPVFVHNDKVICESLAILEYLEEVFPNTKPLLPKDPYERAVVRSYALLIVSSIQPMQNERATHYCSPDDPKGRTAMANYFMNLGLGFLEEKVAKTAKKVALGDELTIADCCIIPQFYNGVVSYGGVKPDDYPTLKRIYQTCLQMECFLNSHPFRQPDTPDNIRKLDPQQLKPMKLNLNDGNL